VKDAADKLRAATAKAKAAEDRLVEVLLTLNISGQDRFYVFMFICFNFVLVGS